MKCVRGFLWPGVRRKTTGAAPLPTVDLPPRDQSGFLSAGNDVLRADVYIAAMGRSGSTVLCDLMTYPKNVCLIEPRFASGARSSRLLQQLRSAQVMISHQEWKALESRSAAGYLERYKTMLSPALKQCDRWAAKEVRPEFHAPTIATINPKRILVLVRNANDVAYSLYDKYQRDGGDARTASTYVREYLSASAKTLVGIASSQNVLVCRYEDFTRSPADMQALAVKLDWPLQGTPNASFDKLKRSAEADRHKGLLTAARSYQGRPPLDFLEAALDGCRTYQETFGYHWSGNACVGGVNAAV